MKAIAKKKFEFQLKPNKTSRHVEFVIELRHVQNPDTTRYYDTLEPVHADDVVLSICASTRKGGAHCQMYDEMLGYLLNGRVRSEDVEKYTFLMEIWSKYHLTELHAGTKAQEDALNHLDSYDYKEQCQYLESIGLYEDRGYRYGTKWLFEKIPSDILDKLKKLIGNN